MAAFISSVFQPVNKRNRVLISVFLVLVSALPGISQKPAWRVRLHPFFDNIEFGGSALKIPQTMAGVRFAPEGGLSWDSIHNIHAGIDVLHEFGSNAAIDNFYPVLYYELNSRPFRFIMGSFPRPEELHDYPRLFFQDSVEYYRPVLNGMYLEYRKKNGYLDLWLDWTGRQSKTVRETFLAGLNGRYNYGILYARCYGYMFHFAAFDKPVISGPLHDNLMSLASLGIDLSGRTFLTRLDANAGWVSAAERARSDNTGWVLMSGFLSEVRAEYRFIGLFNTFYKGSPLMHFYSIYKNDLYWGDPVYRAGTYDRADLYFKFINRRSVSVNVTYSLHFLEGTVYHEQLLNVRVKLAGK